MSNLLSFLVLNGPQVHVWTGTVFCLKMLNLMGHPTALPILEHVYFLICHAEIFVVMHWHSSYLLICDVCKALSYEHKNVKTS